MTTRALLLALAFLAACNSDKVTQGDTSPLNPDGNDLDGDGHKDTVDDCDDTDPSVYGGDVPATETCDGKDNDCNGVVDDGAADATTWYSDSDSDGYGDDGNTVQSCEQPDGYVADGGDCNDDDTDYHPDAPETDCTDPNDYNCDGSVAYADNDGDGFAACEDCDDNNADVNPGADEYCNLVDDNCNGEVDEDPVDGSTYYADNDGDAYGNVDETVLSCEMPSGYVTDATDCDDEVASTNPGADETCNGVDDDCNGVVDDGSGATASTWYADADADGYGDPTKTTSACTEPTGYVADDTDCDDTESTIHPGGTEVCNSKDDDCNGVVDDSPTDGSTYYVDSDGDGFGDPTATEIACSGVTNNLDCDDADAGEPVVVDQAKGSTSGAGTLASPLKDIQSGIDVSTECVVVYAGTYTEAVDFSGRNISVTGIDGASSTTIDASGTGASAVTFASGETSSAVLDGFTVTGGSGETLSSTDTRSCYSGATCYDYYTTYCGGGVVADGASPTLQNLIVENNTLSAASTTTSGYNTYYVDSEGGGLCFRDSSSKVSNLEVDGNFADAGGGIYLDSTSVIDAEQSWVVANEATDGAGAYVSGGTLTYTDVLSTWNDATTDGGGVFVYNGTLEEVNVTHGGESAASTVGAGLYVAGTSSATVMNTIIYGASSGYGVDVEGGASFSGSYNDVYGNSAGNYNGVTDPTGSSGNISSDPKFNSVTYDGVWSNDDWTLAAGSPAIDAGAPAAVYYDADGTRNDQGAYGGPKGDW